MRLHLPVLLALVLLLVACADATLEPTETVPTASTATLPPTPTSTVPTASTATLPPTPTSTVPTASTATLPPTPTSTASPTPEPGFGDGAWSVGEDIPPGLYVAPGGALCYWARLSGFGGNFDEIIANGSGSGQRIVTIDPSDAGFDTGGCGSWQSHQAIASPLAAIPDGMWMVGPEVQPGLYVAPGGALCYWARLSGFGGNFDEILANGSGSGQRIVTIDPSDAGFDTGGCGSWQSHQAIASPLAAIPDGMWMVGPEVQPGTYVAPGGDLCYWARLSGFGGNFDEIIANGSGSGQRVVTIDPSDAGFDTGGCGTWSPG